MEYEQRTNQCRQRQGGDEFIEVYYRRIPCYFNPETYELYGRNWFWELCVEIKRKRL